MTLLYARTVVGWTGGFRVDDKKKWLSGPLRVNNTDWRFNRIYLVLSVLMKDRVPDGFNFIVPRDEKKYAHEEGPVNHATRHTIPLIACMRQVLDELPKGT